MLLCLEAELRQAGDFTMRRIARRCTHLLSRRVAWVLDSPRVKTESTQDTGGTLMLIGINVVLVASIAVGLALYMLRRRTRIIKARFDRATQAALTN